MRAIIQSEEAGRQSWNSGELSMHSMACRAFAITVALLIALLIGVAAQAQTREQCEKRYAPRIGERGKDVIWVPTLDQLTYAMLKAANTTAEDYVIDLGAGDGKIPIAAAKHFGARALGVEYNPQLVKLAQCNVRAEGLTDQVEIREGDIFKTDFSRATVLTLYLLSDLNMRLRPTILQMRPGTRVVSNTFRMGDWSPDQFIESEVGNTRAYLWIVPARVEGTWRFSEENGPGAFRVHLKQHHQELQGSLLGSARSTSLRDARVRGERIEFTVVDREPLKLTGIVREEGIEAEVVRAGKTVRYRGRRD
jgi:SAM-dependent methyltransferase